MPKSNRKQQKSTAKPASGGKQKRHRADTKNALYASLFDHIRAGIALFDYDGCFVYINLAGAEALGKTAGEVIGKYFQDFFPDEMAGAHRTRIREIIESDKESAGERRAFVKGEWHYYDSCLQPIREVGSNRPLALSISFDITERKKTEEALKESEKRFRELTNLLPQTVFELDKDGKIVFANRHGFISSGYTENDIEKGLSVFQLIRPAERNAAEKNIALRLKSIETGRHEYTLMRKDGSSFPVLVYSSPIIHDNKSVGLRGVVVDITERKRAEEALRSERDLVRSILDTANSLILCLDNQARITIFNKECEKITGYSREEVIGRRWPDIFLPDEERHEGLDDFAAWIRQHPTDNYEGPIKTKSGQIRIILWSNSALFMPNSEEFTAVAIGQDISARKGSEIREKARLAMLNDLRMATDIDDCLNLGCRAIERSHLFQRAVMTLHNEKREITNAGFVGLDKDVIDQARKAPAPDEEIARQMTQEKYRISHSYFIPEESNLPLDELARRIAQNHVDAADAISWKNGDELFVPIMGENSKIIGWLSVDTPCSGLRPGEEQIKSLEEIVDIVTQRVLQIKSIALLNAGHQELQQKNIALREVLNHIEDERMSIKRQIGQKIDQILLPALKKITKPDGSINPYFLQILSDNLKELAESSTDLQKLYSRLSPREVEICNMIKQGLSSKDIAKELFITPGTVKRHRESIRRKLELKNKDINLSTFLKSL